MTKLIVVGGYGHGAEAIQGVARSAAERLDVRGFSSFQLLDAVQSNDDFVHEARTSEVAFVISAGNAAVNGYKFGQYYGAVPTIPTTFRDIVKGVDQTKRQNNAQDILSRHESGEEPVKLRSFWDIARGGVSKNINQIHRAINFDSVQMFRRRVLEGSDIVHAALCYDDYLFKWPSDYQDPGVSVTWHKGTHSEPLQNPDAFLDAIAAYHAAGDES